MVKCVFCGKEDDIEQASIKGWVPSFYLGPDDHTEVGGPACDDCHPKHLIEDQESGELMLKPADQPVIVPQTPEA